MKEMMTRPEKWIPVVGWKFREERWPKGKLNLHQKSHQAAGREDSDGSSRALSLEAVGSVFVVVLRCCDLPAFFGPPCVRLMFTTS